jgi:hypothetical protein
MIFSTGKFHDQFLESAKIYYATLHIINGAGRSAVLKPNRGNDDGFPIKPNSTQQIVLMSMSTDNNPIEPVAFHAIDAETSTKLMINHFIRPFVVVPKESKKDLTTILVTSPGEFTTNPGPFSACISIKLFIYVMFNLHCIA